MAITEPTPPPPPAFPDEPATPARPAGNTDDDRGYEVTTRLWLVHGAIIVAFALFITVVSLLFVRWWSGTKVPNASIEFVGDGQLNGVQVRIDGTNLDGALAQKLSAENGYRARFALPAGLYLVRISRDGVPLIDEATVSLHESDAPRYDLGQVIKPAIQSTGSTMPPQ